MGSEGAPLQTDGFDALGAAEGPAEADRAWRLEASDRTINEEDQIEHLQMQVTIHTLPNRADTAHNGVVDNRDRVPPGDAFVVVTIGSVTAYRGGATTPRRTPSNPSSR